MLLKVGLYHCVSYRARRCRIDDPSVRVVIAIGPDLLSRQYIYDTLFHCVFIVHCGAAFSSGGARLSHLLRKMAYDDASAICYDDDGTTIVRYSGYCGAFRRGQRKVCTSPHTDFVRAHDPSPYAGEIYALV